MYQLSSMSGWEIFYFTFCEDKLQWFGFLFSICLIFLYFFSTEKFKLVSTALTIAQMKAFSISEMK